MRTNIRRIGLCLAFGFALLPFAFGQAQTQKPKTAEKTETFKGIVVPLEKLLATQQIKADPDAAGLMVLQAEDGKVYPLVKDAGARMFYKDTRLLNRPIRLTARPVASASFLQVINVHTYVKGQLCEVYYWCDICTIRSFEKGICDCCGGPTELREVPVKE
jgi:hypothetical protein